MEGGNSLVFTSNDPHQRLAQAVEAFFQTTKIEAPTELPRKWLRLQDLVLFNKDAFLSEEWGSASSAPDFWHLVANALKCQRIGRQAEVDAGQMRQSHAELLLGKDGWVEHREHGVTYCFDATKVMFSAGNITERGWMGTISAQGETIVDLFCGIGYYSLPLLVNAGVEKVHACEINPDSIDALRAGLKKNGVAERCNIHVGDNRETAPLIGRVADRVLLGLLPSSEYAWPLALSCLKEEGGILHVHMNVVEKDDGDIQRWAEKTSMKFSELAALEGNNMTFGIDDIRRVKWYSPHVRHCVLILRAEPINA